MATASSTAIEQVLADCNQYFERRPYRRWFDQLESILQACGASYYNGTACHLDLVQWATDPTWAKLPAAVRTKLISEDSGFLNDQLKSEGIRLLLVNGNGVWTQLRTAWGEKLKFVHEEGIDGLCHQATHLTVSRFSGKVLVIAWSTNVQSSFGVTNELRDELARRTAILHKTHRADATCTS